MQVAREDTAGCLQKSEPQRGAAVLRAARNTAPRQQRQLCEMTDGQIEIGVGISGAVRDQCGERSGYQRRQTRIVVQRCGREAKRVGSAHLAPGGRIVLLEAAPAWSDARCNTSVFTARDERTFHEAFARAGLGCTAIHGIDPLPLKTRFLPLYGRLPRPLALLGLAAITAVSLPYDLLFGGRQPQRSWHKLFVLTRT